MTMMTATIRVAIAFSRVVHWREAQVKTRPISGPTNGRKIDPRVRNRIARISTAPQEAPVTCGIGID